MAAGRETALALRVDKSFFCLIVLDKYLEFLLTGESSRVATDKPLGARVPVFDYDRDSSKKPTPARLPFAPPEFFS